MGITYSTYEAKSRFSEVLRQVREGATITISYRGEPVAEIRPIQKETETLEEYFDGLRRQGVLYPASEPRRPFKPSAHVPGALERFLADRNE